MRILQGVFIVIFLEGGGGGGGGGGEGRGRRRIPLNYIDFFNTLKIQPFYFKTMFTLSICLLLEPTLYLKTKLADTLKKSLPLKTSKQGRSEVAKGTLFFL